MKRLLIFGLLMTSMSIQGCYRQPVLDIRYRIFSPEEAALSPGASEDEIAQQFAQAVAPLNRSMQELAEEGFKLANSRLEPSGSGDLLLTFTREIPDRQILTPAPMEYAGVYELAQDSGPSTFYIMDPHPDGYVMHEIDSGGRRAQVARWNGTNLKWRSNELVHTLTLSPDARFLIHTIDSLETGPFVRPGQVTQARRIVPQQ